MGKFLLPGSDDKNLGCMSKALLTFAVIPSLFNYFDLPSYSSELRKRYTLKLLLVCLETLDEGFSWGDWESVSRKLLSLVKLYQGI